MKRFLLLLSPLFFAALLPARAQLQVIYPALSPYHLVWEDVQEFTAINGLPNALQSPMLFTVHLEGQGVILQQRLENLELQPGVQQVDLSLLQRVTLQVHPVMQQIQAGQPFPTGKYRFCLTVQTQQEINQPLESCFPHTVEPVSLPLLVEPADGDTIQTPQPLFVWIPPLPLDFFGVEEYELTVVEVFDQQSKELAIQQNVPLLQVRTPSTYALYPSAAPALEAEHDYACQVQVFSTYNQSMFTEVHQFTLKARDSQIVVPRSYYVRLSPGGNNGWHHAVDELRFKFDSRNRTNIKRWRIKDMAGKVVASSKEVEVEQDAAAHYRIILYTLGGFKHDQHYRLEVWDGDNRRYPLNFLYLSAEHL